MFCKLLIKIVDHQCTNVSAKEGVVRRAATAKSAKAARHAGRCRASDTLCVIGSTVDAWPHGQSRVEATNRSPARPSAGPLGCPCRDVAVNLGMLLRKVVTSEPSHSTPAGKRRSDVHLLDTPKLGVHHEHGYRQSAKLYRCYWS